MLHGVETLTVRGRTNTARAGEVIMTSADEPHANGSVLPTYRDLNINPNQRQRRVVASVLTQE